MWTDPAWRAKRLAQAFADGHTVEDRDGPVTLRHHLAGDLIVTSGDIVACDPGWLDEDRPPFLGHIAPGRYPVVLNIAHFPSGDQRVAYATLRVQDRGPVRSEIAARVGDEAFTATPEGEEYIPNYGVDTGKGCFMDADTLRLLLQQLADESSDEPVYEQTNIGPGYDELLAEAMDKSYVPTWSWADLVVDPDTG
jgi:hypothetical protein